MKTKVFKFILPLLVIVMAVSFAFATNSTSDNQIAHYFDPLFGWQSVVIGDECGPVGENACEFMGKQLYSQPTTESIALRKD
ncbi:DUF6520 family protein [Gelidibacter maritimus]|uniref:Uncharacterized protein n=1 Tax=Gelidibacter maritimus TaxID=2761487 RepID=A0A7W2M5J2_9FLAO|nr:DUF6520 family protein [Gelidibacter maritimus]MBA6153094.1 hypothetical protein [Gelidibacter maritimus]